MLTKKEYEVLKLKQKNLNQTQIAEKLNISQAAVSHFERNALKKIKEAHKIIQIKKKLKIKEEKDIEIV
ncbi:MAG: LuxR C-terminal-related transcriptional regulator [Candidatus Woesearchaeota archaeon]